VISRRALTAMTAVVAVNAAGGNTKNGFIAGVFAVC